MGINVLKNVLPELSEKSGIQVRYTNHSLQATAITRMFNGEVDEKVIAETSGHRSLKALKSYEHTCKRKLQDVSRIINKTTHSDRIGVKSFDSKDKVQPDEQTTSLETDSVKEEVVTNKGEQDAMKTRLLSQAFSGMFSNCTINISLK